MGEGRVGGVHVRGSPGWWIFWLQLAHGKATFLKDMLFFLFFSWFLLTTPLPLLPHTHTHTHTHPGQSHETILIYDLLALCSLDIRVQAAAPMTAVHSTCLLETPRTLYALIVLGWLSWLCQPLGDFNHVKLLLSLMECLSASLCSCLSPLLTGLHVA